MAIVRATGSRITRHLRTALLAAAAGVAMAAAAPVAALPCAGFTDVDTSSPFCPNVEWLRNRAVTLGCGGTLYCPDAAVSRLAMAAFMNRLGTALTPVQLRVDLAPGTVDLDATPVVCQSPDFAVNGFPRRAYADLTFNASALADVLLAADLVMTTNSGASWTTLNSVANRGSIGANQWAALSDIGTADLDVGQTVRFGVRAARSGAGTTDLADSRCQLRVLVYSRDGATSPF